MQKTEKIIGMMVTFVALPLFIFWIGFGHIAPLFNGEFTQHLGAIEVSYITMAKFIKASLPAFSWQPNWYFGYPMSVLYTPLLPFFEFMMNSIAGWSYAHAYRILTGIAYAGGLVTLFFFVRGLFRNTVAGVLAALAYGLLPSVIAFLYQEVAQDVFAKSFIDPRRFTILIRWGEGPHIVSLLFAPLAALGILRFLENGSKWWLVFGALFSAMTVLTNSVGAWGLAILGFCIFIGVIVETSTDKSIAAVKTVGLRSVLFGLVSYGLAAFWFNPLFLSNFFREGSGASSYWKNQFPWGWILIAGFLAVYLFASKKILAKVKGATTATLFIIIMFWFVNTYYASGHEHIEMVPQVLRLNTEVDMGAAMMLGLGVAVIGRFLAKKQRIYQIAMTVVLIIAIVLLLPRHAAIVSELSPYTRSAEEAKIDLTKSAEYEVATTLESKVTEGERVLVPGNYAFYLNYFTDVPQLRGALFQAAIHPWPEHFYYQITNGKKSEITRDLLKIANVGWLVYNGPREIYRDFKVPVDKFDEVLTLDEEKNGDRYYKVPLKHTSLAKVVSTSHQGLTPPTNAIDEEAIGAYVQSIESSDTKLVMRLIKNGTYEISGTVGDEEQILVQMSHVSGWQARNKGGDRLKLQKDPMGFILIDPKQSGEQTIQLTYKTPLTVRIGQFLTVLTLLVILFLIIKIKTVLLLIHAAQPSKKDQKIDSEE